MVKYYHNTEKRTGVPTMKHRPMRLCAWILLILFLVAPLDTAAAQTEIVFLQQRINLSSGDVIKLAYSVSPPDTPLTWKSSAPGVAAVKDGMVYALTGGVAVITVSGGGTEASCIILVDHRHSFGDWETVRAATCTEKGEAVRRCTECGEEKRMELDCLPHEAMRVNERQADCIHEGYTGDVCCVTCGCIMEQGSVIQALGHDFPDSWTVDVPPTFSSPGRQSRHCTRCDAVTDEREIQPLPVNDACDGGAGCPSCRFPDVTGKDWFHIYVDYVTAARIMNGDSDGHFYPNAELTRGQLAQILYNREGRPAASGVSPFQDVQRGQWYFDAVCWAAEKGYVGGYGNGYYGPDDPITREQMVTILWRYVGMPAGTGRTECFVDGDRVSGYAADAIRWAIGGKLLQGDNLGRLNPRGNATRAETAAVLLRFFAWCG